MPGLFPTLFFNRIRMKIIDNKKDYYDYLASIYGIDELVVYDRRGSVTLNSDKVLLHGMEYYFCNRILFRDKPFTDTRSDVQKLESAGFDKKTSFRNNKIKIVTIQRNNIYGTKNQPFTSSRGPQWCPTQPRLSSSMGLSQVSANGILAPPLQPVFQAREDGYLRVFHARSRP